MKKKSILFLCYGLLLLFANQAVSAQSIKASADFRYAELLFEQKHYELAIAQFEEFQQNNPSNFLCGQAQYLIGESYFLMKDYKKAATAFANYNARFFNGDRREDAWFKRAECAELTGNLSYAAETYIAAAENLFDSPQLSGLGYFKAADLYLRSNDYSKALIYFERFTELHTGHELYFSAILKQSEIFSHLGQLNRASHLLEKVEYSGADDEVKWEAFYRRGLFARKIRNVSDSESVFKKVINSAPAESEIHQKTALALAELYSYLNRTDETNALLQTLIAANGNLRAEAQLAYGISLFGLKSYEQAEPLLKGALQNLGKNRDALYYLGLTYRAMNNEVDASAHFARMFDADWYENQDIQLTNYDSDAFLNYIQSSALTNRHVDIRLYAERIRRLSAKFTYANDFIPWVELFLQAGDYDTAEALCNLGIDRTNGTKGVDRLHLLLGSIAEGRALMHRAIAIYIETTKRFPGGDAAKEAGALSNKLSLMNSSYSPQEIDMKRNELTTLAMNSADSRDNSPEERLKFALFSYDYGRRSEVALSALEEIFEGAREGLIYAEALKLGARIHDDLYQLSLEGTPDSKSKEQAATLYLAYISQYAQTEFSSYARQRILELSEIDLSNRNDPGLEQLRIAQDVQFEAYYMIRMAEDALSSDSDSLSGYIQQLSQISEDKSISSDFREKALYIGVQIAVKDGQYSNAAQSASLYMRDFPQGPNAAEMRYRGAEALLNSSDPDNALLWLNDLRNRFYYSSFVERSRILLSDLLVDSGEFESALEIYNAEIASLHPADNNEKLAELIKKTGKVHSLRNSFDEAIDSYRFYILIAQDDEAKASGFFELGKLFEKKLDYRNASASFDQAAKLSEEPELIRTAREKSADILLSIGNITEAGTIYNELASGNYPDSIKASYQFSYLRSLYQRDRRTQANNERGDFDDTFSSLPKSVIEEYIGILKVEEGNVHLRQQPPRFKESQEIFQDVIKDYAGTKAQHYAEYLLGISYLMQNKVDEGTALLENYDRKYPTSPYLYLVHKHYGTVLKNNYEDYRGAFVQFSKAIATVDGSDDAETFRHYIEVAEASGFLEAAITATQNYLKKFPAAEDRMSKDINLGLLYLNVQKRKDAIDHFRSILYKASDIEELQIQSLIGQAYYDNGEYAKAAAEYLRVTLFGTKNTDQPFHVTAQFFAAQCFYQLGNFEKSIDLLDQVVKHEGSTAMGRRAQREKTRIEELLKIRK